jgi:hypothetical protein
VGYLNFPFGLLEQYSFWVDGIYIDITRQKIVGQDEANDDSFTKNFNISAGFLVFFIVTEYVWDWIMSIDPHWFSTLFGWYVLSSFFVVVSL